MCPQGLSERVLRTLAMRLIMSELHIGSAYLRRMLSERPCGDGNEEWCGDDIDHRQYVCTARFYLGFFSGDIAEAE